MTYNLHVFDDVLPDPEAYREEALRSDFATFEFGHAQFHGIALPGEFCLALPKWIEEKIPGLSSTLTFFRKSPRGQQEPNYIHTDVDMGHWTGILYLNPKPHIEDGTNFWTHRQTGMAEAIPGFDGQQDWADSEKWDCQTQIPAKFNRLLLFPASYFHSRSIPENYGEGNEARLIQVVLGTGKW